MCSNNSTVTFNRPLLVPRGHDKLYQLLGLFPRSLVKSDGIQGEGVQTNSAQDDGVKPDSTQTSGAQGHRDGIQSVATEGDDVYTCIIILL